MDGAALYQLVRMYKLTDKAPFCSYFSFNLDDKTKQNNKKLWGLKLANFQGKSVKVRFIRRKNISISKHLKCDINDKNRTKNN